MSESNPDKKYLNFTEKQIEKLSPTEKVVALTVKMYTHDDEYKKQLPNIEEKIKIAERETDPIEKEKKRKTAQSVFDYNNKHKLLKQRYEHLLEIAKLELKMQKREEEEKRRVLLANPWIEELPTPPKTKVKTIKKTDNKKRKGGKKRKTHKKSQKYKKRKTFKNKKNRNKKTHKKN